MAELRPERLLLREWRDEDLEPFAELNGDAETMRFFPSPPETARAAVAYGFEELVLDEIVSFTSELNEPSRRVMERLGMSHDPAADFEHPRVPAGNPLRPHVLYRLDRPAWAVS